MAVTAHFQAAHGTLPTYANKAGHEADQTPLYLARALHEGGLHPGKYRAGWTAASISYGGGEVWISSYEVWTGRLSDGSPGTWIPSEDAQPGGYWDPVVCGREADGTPLYAARAPHDGGMQVGKWRQGWTVTSIPYGGKELWLSPFELLCPGTDID
jgi:Protein of unknown function (DUF3421)